VFLLRLFAVLCRVDGVPALGWDDTKLFLIVPVVLVVSQYLSQALITPKNQDPSQQQANTILKVLPLMIGWFSLNVPAALGIYWVANNIITTAITMQIRSAFEASPAAASVESSSSTTSEPFSSSAFRPAPMREKPSGFAASVEDPDSVKPITTIDAEIVAESTNDGESTAAEPKASFFCDNFSYKRFFLLALTQLSVLISSRRREVATRRKKEERSNQCIRLRLERCRAT
jgi:hypothetical protein